MLKDLQWMKAAERRHFVLYEEQVPFNVYALIETWERS